MNVWGRGGGDEEGQQGRCYAQGTGRMLGVCLCATCLGYVQVKPLSSAPHEDIIFLGG